MSVDDDFRLITGFKELYPHQRETIEYLSNGKSVVLRAPTGSGKSEAVVVPFLTSMNKTLPSQMLYSLPVRTLVDDLSSRFAKYSNVKWLSVAGHHGKRIETPLFYPPIIVTTIDQTVGAYVCTPLSLSLRHGNIPAGAVSSALLVFDEVHTFDPERALQSALILAKHSNRLNLPFVFMSATMPDLFIKKLEGTIDFEKVDADEKDIPTRKNRDVLVYWEGRKLTSKDVMEKYNASKGKTIAVCNTVGKAQEIYGELKGKVDCELILLHSRFLEEDRSKKEEKLKEIFEKGSERRGILVSTQVIEVGLDISCDTMLTELSPIDSLIQRAGRCGRWGGEGRLYVYDIEKPNPYRKDLVDETRKKIKEIDGRKFDWKAEKALVNDILGEYAREWLKIENTARILNTLAQAAFEGNRKLVADAVRETFSCEISIHDDPNTLENAYGLKKIKVPVGVLRKFFRDSGPIMWKLVDNNIISDEAPEIVSQQILRAEEIVPYEFYIIHPDHISYDDKGLLFKPKGENFECIEQEERREFEHEYKKETWVEHSMRTLEVFESIFLPRYRFAIDKFAKAWKVEFSEFLEELRLVMLLHDIGKLNERWQNKIGWDGKEPLAHSGEDNVKSLPSHASISAHSLKDVFKGWKMDKAVIYAIAHHHSVRASTIPMYEFITGWRDQILEVTEDVRLKINLDEIKSRTRSRPPRLRQFPDIMNEKLYRTYAFVSRILRLSDQIATAGGEGAVLRYENWHGNVRC